VRGPSPRVAEPEPSDRLDGAPGHAPKAVAHSDTESAFVRGIVQLAETSYDLGLNTSADAPADHAIPCWSTGSTQSRLLATDR
jgi:hypothetical protein